jgi:hypothetical protein
VGLAGAYREGIGIGLLSLALTLPTGAFTFWFGARRVRHKLLGIEVAIAAVCFWLGRRPPFPEIADETRS